MKTQSNKNIFISKTSKCSVCSKEFKYESELKRHEISHDPQFECKVCSKKFSFQSAVRRHEKQHQRTGRVACEHCRRFFRDETLLKRHLQYAHKGTFNCKKCQALFNSEVALKIHSKTHKPLEDRQYRCKYTGCNKSFNFPHHLKHHELTHTIKKQYYCNTCGKGFIQLHHMKAHTRSHEVGSGVACPLPDCAKTFLTEYAMKRHLATHKNLRHDVASIYGVGETLKDIALCNSCGKILSKKALSRHIIKCKPELVSEVKGATITKNETSDDHNATTDLISPLDETEPNKDDPNEALPKIEIDGLDLKGTDSAELEGPLSSCKIVLGGCLTENGDSKNECLCEQMKIDNKVKPSNKNKLEYTRTEDNDKANEVTKEIDMCEGCECAKICSSTVKAKCKGPMPEIEYRLGGIVKLKETFDFDIDIKPNDAEKGQDKLNDNLNAVLFHSCKDVIGNCIVSGNSTMGEGCLCAKMSMNNQGNIDQEIEDITPCPKTW